MRRVSADAPLLELARCAPSVLTRRPPVAKELITLLRARTEPDPRWHSRFSAASSPPPTWPLPDLHQDHP